MKRLAEADISVLAWDLSFVPETPGDVAFVEGVQALQEQGVPVIVVHPSWGIPPDGELRMSPVIAPHVSYAYAAHIDRPRGWEYVPKDGWSHVALAHDRGLHAHRKIPLRVQG